MVIDKSKGKESFKKFYINKYLNTLLYHSAALAQKGAKEELQKILLGSIMRNESYYKYSETPDVFRQIFRKAQND